MDHPTSLRRESPWRTTAMVASAVAALELVLLVALGAAVLAKPFISGDGDEVAAVQKALGAVTGTSAKPAPTPKLTREETRVLVLNGNGSTGAASDKAALVSSRGYLIAGTGNAPRTDFARSLVMFRPGHRGEAERLARDFKVARVAPLDGLRPAQLQGAHVALIVGRS